ncbi:hypothetical protein BBF96_12315 [Anoxybacter fermentans]|uniref:VCBS repeat-containing protein n=1 Tax=Anoxybacter fermentans TaxID=1323375 RepID=A0A3S9T0J3_9FIRM|nr:hypothetical protein [Anoxybacter fermentans]AZR74113.1 hypothetical protein BBF96_12315 [Anoxybacter fermentans]
MKFKVIIAFLALLVIVAVPVNALQSYYELFWTNSDSSFAVGNYGDRKLLFTVGLSKFPDDLSPNGYIFNLYELSFQNVKKIEIEWSSIPEFNGYILARFCDFDQDGNDELFVVRNFENIFLGEIYIYKIQLEKGKANLIWNEDIPGRVFDAIKLDNYNLLVQVENVGESYMYVFGYDEGGIKKKWELMYEDDIRDFLHKRFMIVDERKIYVETKYGEWKHMQIVNNEIAFPESSTKMLINPELFKRLNKYEYIGLVDLDDDEELETIKKVDNYVEHIYLIYGIESGREKFRIKLSSRIGIEGYIPSQSGVGPRILLTNGYAIFWEEGRYVYKPWIEELSLSYTDDVFIHDFVNEDIDNDGLLETMFLRENTNLSDEVYKVEFWMIKY